VTRDACAARVCKVLARRAEPAVLVGHPSTTGELVEALLELAPATQPATAGI
jgi:hypothetical protein